MVESCSLVCVMLIFIQWEAKSLSSAVSLPKRGNRRGELEAVRDGLELERLRRRAVIHKSPAGAYQGVKNVCFELTQNVICAGFSSQLFCAHVLSNKHSTVASWS